MARTSGLPLLLIAFVGCTVDGTSVTPSPSDETPRAEASCADGRDDDRDGDFDCDDPDCDDDAACAPAPLPETTAARCQNGHDDDGDGYVDCDDFGCTAFCDEGEAREDSAALCQNGDDDDDDGYVDCDDWDCEELSVCAPVVTTAACVDAAKSTCDAGVCAAERSTLGSCITSCGVFASAECVSSYCDAAVAAYVDCMMRDCAPLADCGGACAKGCTNLAACNGITEAACQQSCATVAPNDVPLLVCGAVTACEFLPACNSLATGCGREEWACGDGACVPLAQACDGDATCGDQSDETLACELEACPSGARLCDGGCRSCPAHAAVTTCDEDLCTAVTCEPGFDVCSDGCCPHTSGCYSTEFTCDDGACIPEGKQCDGALDCADRSDEDRRCPEVATLYDPARPSLTHECTGTTLTQEELAALFDPGTSVLSIDPLLIPYSRRCNGLTGCTAWTAASYYDSYAFDVRYEADGDLAFARARSYATNEGYTVIAAPDFVVYGLMGWDLDTTTPVRVRFAHDAGGGACVQMTIPSWSDEGDGFVSEGFGAGKVIVRPALAGSVMGEPPAEPGAAYHCSGAPASTSALAAAWFAPGEMTSSLYDLTREKTGVYRRCYARTGCSAWGTWTPSLEALSLQISGDAIELRISDGSYSSSTLPVVGGLFAGALGYPYDWSASGHVATTCLEATYVRAGSFEYAPDTEQVAWEAVRR